MESIELNILIEFRGWPQGYFLLYVAFVCRFKRAWHYFNQTSAYNGTLLHAPIFLSQVYFLKYCIIMQLNKRHTPKPIHAVCLYVCIFQCTIGLKKVKNAVKLYFLRKKCLPELKLQEQNFKFTWIFWYLFCMPAYFSDGRDWKNDELNVVWHLNF